MDNLEPVRKLVEAATNYGNCTAIKESGICGQCEAELISALAAVTAWLEAQEGKEKSDIARDRLWCKALASVLLAEDIQKVTHEFNRIRPDRETSHEQP